MMTHSALVNHGGGLRKERGIVYANPVWWTTHLYATQPCLMPVDCRAQSPSFRVEGKWFCKPGDVPALDAVALVDEGGTTCAIFLVNRSRSETLETNIAVTGFRASATAEVITLAGPFDAANSWRKPEVVRPVPSTAAIQQGAIHLTIAPTSLVRIILKATR